MVEGVLAFEALERERTEWHASAELAQFFAGGGADDAGEFVHGRDPLEAEKEIQVLAQRAEFARRGRRSEDRAAEMQAPAKGGARRACISCRRRRVSAI